MMCVGIPLYVVFALLLLLAVFVVVRRKWYGQAALLVAACLGLACSLFGLRRWFVTDSVSAVVLAAVGVVALIAAGTCAWRLRIKMVGSEPGVGR